MQRPHIGIYPGTFDPITHGHVDIIARGSRMVDELIVAVAENAGKGPLFSLSERVALVQEVVAPLGNVKVLSFGNLLVHFAQQQGARMIIRGLRAVSDFEFEFQMAGMNARLSSDLETVFLMASERTQFISSRFVKEIGRLGGDISNFVAPIVAQRLEQRFQENRQLDGFNSIQSAEDGR